MRERTERQRSGIDAEAGPDTDRVCSECGGTLRESETETVCEDCGLVLAEDAVERGPEWRSLDEETDRRRTGAPLTASRHDRGLSTEIGYGTGSEVSGARQRQLVRMRRQHNRARLDSKAERNKLYAYTEIRRLVSVMSLPTSVRDQSCSLFSSAQSEDLLCGRSLEGFAAAVVYATCRTQSIARTMDEIVGAYVVLMSVILTTLSIGLRHGLDRSLVGYHVGRSLVSSTPLYVLAVFFVGMIM